MRKYIQQNYYIRIQKYLTKPLYPDTTISNKAIISGYKIYPKKAIISGYKNISKKPLYLDTTISNKAIIPGYDNIQQSPYIQIRQYPTKSLYPDTTISNKAIISRYDNIQQSHYIRIRQYPTKPLYLDTAISNKSHYIWIHQYPTNPLYPDTTISNKAIISGHNHILQNLSQPRATLILYEKLYSISFCVGYWSRAGQPASLSVLTRHRLHVNTSFLAVGRYFFFFF